MPLPTPDLDDRRFQQIVDEAKRRIPIYCPEWTDHNVSDPGIALIELFAWMTDMLLYRVNQVPDKMYIKFLELIGVRLDPPRPARAPVTFYLSAPQPSDVIIPDETEVATVRTETSPAIIFTTEEALTIRPPVLAGALTRNHSRSGNEAWYRHDLRLLDLPNQRIKIFPDNPGAGDALYLGLERDHSHHVLALVMECSLAGGAGVDPTRPPIEWQVWQGGLVRWATCQVEHDGTGGFNWSGEIILRLPDMMHAAVRDQEAFWLRCRLTEAQSRDEGSYRVPPEITSLRVESRGGTVYAHHAVTQKNEILGESDGTPGQEFRLAHAPVLARNARRDYMVVAVPGEPEETWQEVADFADSGPADRHFTLDSLDGVVTVGPALPQPDGSIRCFGATPPAGSTLCFSRYQYGGGVIGNVPMHELKVLKTSMPYVARVTNWEAAEGGMDAQSLEDAKLRAPKVLRTRTRAMSADDYEYLACEVQDVARAYCLAPGALPGRPDDPQPGQVVVVVLPSTGTVAGYIPPEDLKLSAEVQKAVEAYLDARRPLGITLEVRAAHYIWVSVTARLNVAPHSEESLIEEVEQQARDALYRYLNPHTGGPQGQGWPFGRDLHISEIYGLLQRVAAVEYVGDVQVGVAEPGSLEAPRAAPPRLTVPRHGLICSYRHEIRVQATEL